MSRSNPALQAAIQALTKTAKHPKAKANDLVDMRSTSGLLADTLMPDGFGGSRAGASQAMSEALGQTAPFSVRHPVIAGLAAAIPGALAGGLGGAALGAGLDHGTGDMAPLGAALGAGGGAILGGGLAGLWRRGHMANTNAAFDAADSVSPQVPELSTIGSLLGRGPHQAGRVNATAQMMGDAPDPSLRLQNILNLLNPESGNRTLQSVLAMRRASELKQRLATG